MIANSACGGGGKRDKNGAIPRLRLGMTEWNEDFGYRGKWLKKRA